MRKQVTQRYGLGVTDWDPEVQIVVYVAVQVQQPLVAKLHNGCPCEQLGDRPDPEESGGRVHRCPLLDVCEAVAAECQNLTVPHDGHTCTCNGTCLQVGGYIAVEPIVQVVDVVKQGRCARLLAVRGTVHMRGSVPVLRERLDVRCKRSDGQKQRCGAGCQLNTEAHRVWIPQEIP